MVRTHEGKKGQQGFTLIEIIAVLVILGILAAVAVPKYIDMQEKSKGAALNGACAALNSNVSLAFANRLLQGDNTTTARTYAITLANVSDIGSSFTVSALTAPAGATPGVATIAFSAASGITAPTTAPTCNVPDPVPGAVVTP